MTKLSVLVIAVAIATYGLLLLAEAIRNGTRPIVVEVVLLAGVVLLLHFATGFPRWQTSFGGISPIVTLAIMFVCILLGMAAHYFFYLKRRFSWISLLKPMCVSPIVLLPLIGSVQGSVNVSAMQTISFAFLAFQNGFFWRMVFDDARGQV